jgi:hypothetical protein
MHSMHSLHRCFTVLAVVTFCSGLISPVLHARPAGVPPLPEPTAAIHTGVVFAYGNELVPPYTVAVEDQMLCVYDGTGRRFAGGSELASGKPPVPAPEPPLQPQMNDGADVAAPNPTIAAAQVTHLLSRGGLVALGRTYLRAFPAATALSVLEKVRWIVQHAGEITLAMPPGDDSFLGDLLKPAPLPPPRGPVVGTTS